MAERTRQRFEDDTPIEAGPRGVPLSAVIVGGLVAVFLALAVGAAGGYVAGRAKAVNDARAELAVVKAEAESRRAAEEKARDDAEAARMVARDALEKMDQLNKVKQKPVPPPPPQEKKDDRRASRPTTEKGFKAVVWGHSRDHVATVLGAPDDIDESVIGAGWDGPAAIYFGPFTDDNGGKKAKARVYYKRVAGGSTASLIDFLD
jgi:hypothetical protein